MKTALQYFIILCLAVTFSSCINYDHDRKPQKSIYGKWKVTKYEFTYFDGEFGWVTDYEYPVNEGYYEEYTFKQGNVYYYLYEDEYEMELYKGLFEFRRSNIWLDNIEYSIYINEYTMTLETTYDGHTTEITFEYLN